MHPFLKISFKVFAFLLCCVFFLFLIAHGYGILTLAPLALVLGFTAGYLEDRLGLS